MATRSKQRVIALEEHYLDLELSKYAATLNNGSGLLRRHLDDLGSLRLKDMD